MTTAHIQPPPSLNLGQQVTFKLGKSTLEGVVVEYRGPLGFDGHHIYRIRITDESFPEDLREVELPQEELTIPSAA
jgi:hypothetical protein